MMFDDALYDDVLSYRRALRDRKESAKSRKEGNDSGRQSLGQEPRELC